MSTAEATREAVRARPFLEQALRAGVLNYSAAAALLDDAGDTEAVATALRRYADDLPPLSTADADARVRMESGIGLADTAADPADALLAVGGATVVPDGGSLTAILATGDVDATALGAVCARLDTEGIDAEAAAVADGTLLVVVARREGVATLRAVEDALERVPA